MFRAPHTVIILKFFQKLAERLHWTSSVPVGIVISIFGLIGNVLSIVIWRRILRKNFGRNKSTAIYLIALAVADIALLFFFLLHDSLPKLFASLQSTMSFCYFFSYVAFPFFFLSIVASIWLLVCVSLNRFIMVNFPVKAKTYCSAARAHLGIGITLTCCFIVNLPHFFNYSPKLTSGNVTQTCLTPTEYGKSSGSINYEFWVHCIILVLAPWASIAFCNAGIIYALYKRTKKAAKQFSKSKEDGGKDKQMTRMLLTVTFAFLILLAWQCITQCFYMLGYGKPADMSKWDVVDKSFAMAKLGVVINSSINFILYSCSGSVFRKELYSMFETESGSKYKQTGSTSTGSKFTNDSFVGSETKL